MIKRYGGQHRPHGIVSLLCKHFKRAFFLALYHGCQHHILVCTLGFMDGIPTQFIDCSKPDMLIQRSTELAGALTSPIPAQLGNISQSCCELYRDHLLTDLPTKERQNEDLISSSDEREFILGTAPCAIKMRGCPRVQISYTMSIMLLSV